MPENPLEPERDGKVRWPYMAAGILILAICVLSLLPDSATPRLSIPGWIGHFCIYYGAAVVLVLVFPGRRRVLTIIAALATLAGLMEIGQYLSPGRTPQLSDFISGALGAAIGATLTARFRPDILRLDRDKDRG